jgi:hypothetical protein
MQQSMRPEIVCPRTVSTPAGSPPSGFRPWAEVAALVRASVAAWDLTEETWVHWAAPVAKGSPDPGGAFPFDPGRRAAFPGEPPAEQRLEELALDEAAAESLCEALLSGWCPGVHYNTVLRLRSRLDEPVETFKHWCASLVSGGPRVRKGSALEREAADRVAKNIVTRVLSGGEIEVVRLRVGIGWYPEGVEPAPCRDDRP